LSLGRIYEKIVNTGVFMPASGNFGAENKGYLEHTFSL